MQLLVYPNPSNQTVRLIYEIPDNKSNDLVELTIHNILGRKVATLFSGQRSPGHHETSWETNDQPSGIYFASLKAGKETIIQRIILVK
ncbi:MAG: T9SS type A sorting domain-containing protein [candidate division WOR-3 bacterium]